jgi:hypothetical protein
VRVTTSMTHGSLRRRGSSTTAVRNRGRARSRGERCWCFTRRKKGTLLHRVPVAADKDGRWVAHVGTASNRLAGGGLGRSWGRGAVEGRRLRSSVLAWA